MTARLPTQLTTVTGAALPLPAMPQDKLLSVNVERIPLLKDLLGVPGIHIKPLRLDPERNEWVFMAVLAPGCTLPLHYHTGPAQVYTLSGRWCYREYPDQPQTAGSYLYEPAGSVHTLVVPEENTEPTDVFFAIWGANLNLDADGNVESVLDAGMVLQGYYLMCEAAGLPKPPVVLD